VATKEAASHEEYNAAVTRAKAADTVLTVCFQDGWPKAPHRALRNRTFEMWEAAGCPPIGQRPGEGDILGPNATTGAPKRRYSAVAPLRDDRGAIAEMALWAGEGADAIRDIPSAGELVARLWKECLDVR
jgi:nitronate monooxygenase